MSVPRSKYPTEIYVEWEYPGSNEDPFLIVREHYSDAAVVGDKVKIAIYKLVRVAEVSADAKLK